jgi:hypothetical protein
LDCGDEIAWSDVLRVGLTEPVECDYPSYDTAVDQEVGQASDSGDNVKKEILLLCQQLIPRGGRSVGNDGVSGEEKD